MRVKVIKDYYDTGVDLYQKAYIELREGVTILVGCNGYGKSTFLNILKSKCEYENIPLLLLNAHTEGNHFIEKAFNQGNINLASTALISSEGENIVLLVADFIKRVGQWIQSILKNFDVYKKDNNGFIDAVLIMDSVDSGLSIDNIIEIKNFLGTLISDFTSNKIRLHIVISTNSYEFTIGYDCLDVVRGKYRGFRSYIEFKNFILQSRDRMNRRNDSMYGG